MFAGGGINTSRGPMSVMGPAAAHEGRPYAGDGGGQEASTGNGGRSSELSELEIQSLYAWIDEVQLSRPKKNFTRDFSDGVNTAEIIKHFIPKLVDLHNYSPANATTQKVYNWRTLNHKVFRRLGYTIGEDVIQEIVNCRPGYVEVVLNELRKRIDEYITRHHKGPGVVTWPEGSEPQLSLEHEPQQQRQGAPVYTYALQEQLAAPMQSVNGGAMGHGVLPSEASNSRKLFTETTAVSADPGMVPPPPDAMLAGIRVADFPYILQEKNRMIAELQDTAEILQLKVAKLEELLVLKNRRIEELTSQLR